MDKFIILGTSEDQHPLIRKAKELGYETHICGWKIDMVKDRIGDVYHEVDLLDYEALWNEVKDLDAIGVATCASELAMYSMNYLLRKMGIPCNSIETDKIATNKYLMRRTMKNAGILSPHFELVNVNTDKAVFESFIYPVIIKPIDESSSRGVTKVNNIDEVVDAIKFALSWSKADNVIMEDFIEGQEYSGESIAYEGKYKLLAVTEKTTTGAPHFVERGHKQPASLSKEMYDKLEKTLYKAFNSMGIKYGAIHPEFRITTDNRIYFMEIAARMGGGFIGSDLTFLSSGYDFLKMMIDVGCGRSPVIERTGKQRNAEVRFILNQSDLDEMHRLEKRKDIKIIKYSKWKEISDKQILQNPDRAGYYIFVEKLDGDN